eukprot:TRINITY_DN6644_c0_g1_i1.p1 TRINITY_DN6644_c0_g1~~TRINITY_DN6644_c0_g1_i1.p1  ORF type:complete len:673 (-),score=84.40 TRINITY_DN6644_c0_g1_i1:1362-3380(-)
METVVLGLDSSHDGSRRTETETIIAEVVENDDLIGYILSFMGVEQFVQSRLCCKRLRSHTMLRHLRNVRFLSSSSDDDSVFEFLAQHAEHLTGLRCIDWYFRNSDCDPLKRLIASRGYQLEQCVNNNCSTSGFYEVMNPKVLTSLEFTVGDIPESVLQTRFPKLEKLCINTNQNNYAADFVSSLDSLLSLDIYTSMDLEEIDVEVLADSIRRIVASNRMLRRLNIDVYHRVQYEVLKALLLGKDSPDDLVLGRVEELVKTRLSISPEALTVGGLNVWAAINLSAPAEQFRNTTDVLVWRRLLDACHETVSDKLVALGRFMLRLCDPEVFQDKSLVDLYIALIDNILDDVLAIESRFDPLLKTSSNALVLLNWGGLKLMRSSNDIEVKRPVVERCSSTLRHSPNLLEICADTYPWECDMDWTTSPSVHLVMEIGEWYEPTTLVLKEEFSELRGTRQVLLGMAVHPKFNPDVKTHEGDHLCRAMLQSLLDNYVPTDPSNKAAYTLLAKMCTDRNLKIQITPKLSVYSLQNMFANDEILELFSRLADNIGRLCDGEIVGHTAFGRSEKLFRGISFMLKKMEERGEYAAEQVAEWRRSVSRPIWATFQRELYSLFGYQLSPPALAYVFEICPDLPDWVPEYLEKADANDLPRKRLLEHMKTDERLRKYLPSSEVPN